MTQNREIRRSGSTSSSLLRPIASDRLCRRLLIKSLSASITAVACFVLCFWTFVHWKRAYFPYLEGGYGITDIMFRTPQGRFIFWDDSPAAEDIEWAFVALDRTVEESSSIWAYPIVRRVESSLLVQPRHHETITRDLQDQEIKAMQEHILRTRPDWADDVLSLNQVRYRPHWAGIGWNLLRYGSAAVGAAAMVGVFFPATIGLIRRLRRLLRGACPNCGYGTTASMTLCPECGETIALVQR